MEENKIIRFDNEKETNIVELIKHHPDGLTFLQFIEKTECTMPKMYINSFHKHLLMNSTDQIVWVSLTEELINLIGFKGEILNRNKACMKILNRNFKKDKDFKEVDKESFIEPSGSMKKNENIKSDKRRKKYYLITGDCVEQLLMMTRTETANTTRENYIKLRKIITKYCNYQQKHMLYIKDKESEKNKQLLIKSTEQLDENKQQLDENKQLLEEKDKQLKIEQGRHIALREVVDEAMTLEKKQIFYIATSDYYQKRNRYKFGGVESQMRLKSRLSSYNGDRAEGDRFYFIYTENCHDYKSIEAYLRGHLPDYCKDSKDRYLKEMVKCPWVIFKEIVKLALHPSGKITDLINEKRDDIINGIIIDDPIRKPPIKLQDYKVYKNNTDVEKLSTIEITEIMTDIVNQAAEAIGHIAFDFSTQKDEQLDMELKWKDITKMLLSKLGVTKKKLKVQKIWKPKLKEMAGNKCISKIRWR